MTRFILFAVALLVATSVISTQLFALPHVSPTILNPRVLDQDTYLDINKNLVFLDNVGNLGADNGMIFGKTDGWYYPFTGDIADILDETEDRTVVYSSGICLGGMVDGQVRVALTEYDAEFVPGPMSGGSNAPDEPRFRVYKLDQTSGPGDADWDEWPSDLGAPLNQFGFPLVRGDQCAWTLFNDADAAGHGNNAGNTAPLGVEVQVAAWAYAAPQGEDVIHVRYKLCNKGSNVIDDFYFSFWADPDLGQSNDDLVGCEPSSSSFFCYNGDNLDDEYGALPPAWGGRIVSGFLVPAAGEIGIFDGNIIHDHRNLEMSAFNKYINGTDPNSAQEFYNSIKGLNKDGTVMIDPITMSPTTFAVSGDPVGGTGWLDSAPSDRRLMASIGPISFNPGDSQQVEIEFGTRMGTDYLNSITELFAALEALDPHTQPPATYVDRDALYAYQLFAIDPEFPVCYVGQFDEGYTANDVVLGSLLFDALVPSSSEIVDPHPEYGGPAVKLQFSVDDYLEPLMPLLGSELRDYSVSGQYLDGTPFQIFGQVVVVGKEPGDLNGDRRITVSDAVGIVNFIFASGDAPQPLLVADTDCSGTVTVSDAIWIINFIFASGPAPCASN